ncbi:MAG: glycosyltransferase family 2 protein [Lachnospiraceae bacterium]|jgi:dolichol-phosphate mannosyltransferase|nr:glycosyltransferase family 2 protein [Lachnospiraceae bacterium]
MSRCISVIVSVYNEENALERFYETTNRILKETAAAYTQGPCGYQLLFVNDGSTDRSAEILDKLREADPDHVSVIRFSRNFGHEAAMTAGLDYACGDWLIFMDADLQHPPAMIPAIMDRFAEGYNIINMVRTRNETAGTLKNITSGMYYRLINRISDVKMEPAASDFFAMDRAAAEVLRHNYREKVRFLRGFVQNIGFRKTTLSYEAAARVAGQSHYSFKKLWKLSMDSIICFSNMPLKLGIYAGFLSGLLGVLLIVYTLITREGAPSGYATIVIALCFMFAVLFMLLGIMGGYIAILFREMQDRPIYIIEDIRDEAGTGSKEAG